MEQKIISFQNKGMLRDLSISKINNEFAFENFNIRITALENNNLLSVTNEKGNIPISIKKEYPKQEITIHCFSDGEWNINSPLDVDIKLVFIDIDNNKIETTINKGETHGKHFMSTEKKVSIIKTIPYNTDKYLINIIYTDNNDITHSFKQPDKEEFLEIKGTLLGNSVLNNYLVLFTKENNTDYIYRIEHHPLDNSWTGKEIFKGNLNLSIDNPIETISSYESEEVQKVYWVDGRNQPRIINIKNTYYDSKLLDFIPSFFSNINVEITKNNENKGLFPSGTIQYFITYYKKFGQETKIAYASPLYYSSPLDRGGSPEETCTNSFTIKITNIDDSYDYVRVYSTVRTSLSGNINAYIVGDYNITKEIIIEDVGKNTPISPTKLLNLGEDIITADTMAQKDNTLFLGNISIPRNTDYGELEQLIKKYCFIHNGEFEEGNTWECKDSVLRFENNKILYTGELTGLYPYNNQLQYAQDEISYFKGGEKYRFSIQFEDNYGVKTKSFWIGDKENTLYPEMHQDKYILTQVIFNLPKEIINYVKDKYKKVILLRAETSNNTRSILAQGILNPTLFNLEQRYTNQRFAIPSWFMRPDNSKFRTNHFDTLGSSKSTMGEIQCNSYEVSEEIKPFITKKELEKPSKEIVSYKYVIAVKYVSTSIPGYYGGFIIELTYSDQSTETIYELNDNEVWTLRPYTTFILLIDSLNLVLKKHGVYTLINYDLFNNWLSNIDFFNGNVYYYNRNTTILSVDTQGKLILNKEIIKDSKVKSSIILDTNDDYLKKEHVNNYKDVFFIDRNIVTFNSPDIDNLQNYDKSINVKFRIVGTTSITGNISDYYIDNKHPIAIDNYQLVHDYSTTNVSENTEGLIAAPLIIDSEFPDNPDLVNSTTGYMIYPWHKNGSIINYTTEGNHKNELIKKNIANLRFANNTEYFNSDEFKYPTNNLEDLRVITATESQAYSIKTNFENKLYTVNNKFLILPKQPFNILKIPTDVLDSYTDSNINIIEREGKPVNSIEGVKVAYKSEKHALLSLGSYTLGDSLIYNILPYEHTQHITSISNSILTWSNQNSFFTESEAFQIAHLSNDVYVNSEVSYTNSSDLVSRLDKVIIDYPYKMYKDKNEVGYFKDKNILLKDSSNSLYTYFLIPAIKGTYRPLLQDPSFSISFNLDTITIDFLDPTNILDQYINKKYKVIYKIIKIQDEVITEEIIEEVISKSKKITGLDNTAKYKIEIQFINPSKYSKSDFYQNSNKVSSGEVSQGETNTDNTISYKVNPEDDNVTYFTSVIPIITKNMTVLDAQGNLYKVTPQSLEKIINYKHFGFYDCGIGEVVKKKNRLLIGELYIEYPKGKLDSRYGGINKFAIDNNKFIPIGSGNLNDTIIGKTGDTYIQRYDCYKTIPFSPEETNSVIDITSFMVETHSNIDGRYDNKRGQQKLSAIKVEDINKINPVYTQSDNFISSFTLDSKFNSSKFPSTFIYSIPKLDLEDIDSWTDISLSSSFTLDTNKGKISAIRKFNNTLISFQDKGISEILYNSRTPLSTTSGIPIELGNSNKVDGNRYISENSGCINKWSIVETIKGIYYIDNLNSSINLFNGNINSISEAKGFKSWIGNNNSIDLWNPKSFNNFIAFWDRLNDDVYFIKNNVNPNHNTLCFNEQLMQFTSFYNYGKVPMMININDKFVSFKNNKLWLQNEGNYNNIFGEIQDFSVLYRITPDPYGDKIFSTIEYRADTFDMDISNNNSYFENKGVLTEDTFNTLKVWNEYQENEVVINKLTSNKPVFSTKDNYPDVRRKFRIWRMDIPRDKKGSDNPYGLNRIRNPWIYLKLTKRPNFQNERMEFHDLTVRYFE